MYKVALKRLVYPIIILGITIAIILLLLGAKKLNDKVPSRGTFVYTQEFYKIS